MGGQRPALPPFHRSPVGEVDTAGGVLENGETVIQGAIREALEEAHARVTELLPFALFDLPFVNQVHLMFRAKLVDSHVSAGHETIEVDFFKEDTIPWRELAFPVVEETLRLYYSDRGRGMRCFHLKDIPPSRWLNSDLPATPKSHEPG